MTPAQLASRQKPQLQIELIKMANRQFGVVGRQPANQDEWLEMLDIYLYMQQLVDEQVGVALDALDAHPDVKDNTVVIFTSDHGDYCGSHGLRGKGGAVYEGSIWVPFYLKDYSGKLAAVPGQRTQLTSHMDLTPLLMTIAYGGKAGAACPKPSIWMFGPLRDLDFLPLTSVASVQQPKYVCRRRDSRAARRLPAPFPEAKPISPGTV